LEHALPAVEAAVPREDERRHLYSALSLKENKIKLLFATGVLMIFELTF
jgi:hypothetical protein